MTPACSRPRRLGAARTGTVKLAPCPAQAGLIFVSDPVHGRVSTQLKGRYGYGSWLAPMVGVWELVIVGRMWCSHGGAQRVAAMRMLSTLMGGAFYSHVIDGDPLGSLGPIAFATMSVWVLGWTMAAVKSQAFFFTVGALIGIFVSTLSPGKPNEDSKVPRPFMGRQASWLSELSTSTTAGGKRD